MQGKRIVITGATGQVGAPIARALAGDNEVIGPPGSGTRRCASRSPTTGSTACRSTCGPVTCPPSPATASTPASTSPWRSRAGGTSTSASPRRRRADLMTWCRPARFLHCSSTGVYQPRWPRAIGENDPLGDNHRVMLPTYSISKIAAEAVVRSRARQLDLPTTIARLAVPYGDNGGWPLVHLAMMQRGHARSRSTPTRPPSTTHPRGRHHRARAGAARRRLRPGDRRQLGRSRGGRASRSGAPTSASSSACSHLRPDRPDHRERRRRHHPAPRDAPPCQVGGATVCAAWWRPTTPSCSPPLTRPRPG